MPIEVSRPPRCSVADANSAGVHSLCPNNADGWWSGPDGDGRMLRIAVCTTHLFQIVRDQQTQREKAAGG
ncbi:MAG: hypothetical protein ACHQ0J_15365 [Candidatus Dormibacterales bacterium]